MVVCDNLNRRTAMPQAMCIGGGGTPLAPKLGGGMAPRLTALLCAAVEPPQQQPPGPRQDLDYTTVRRRPRRPQQVGVKAATP